MNFRFYLNVLLVFCSISLMGQTGKFRIFGTVYNTDKKTVADWTVAILGDPNTPGIKLQTDQNGNYESTFEASSNARVVYQILVTDPCQNVPLVQKAEFKIGEERHDFVICAKNNPPANPCDGRYDFVVHPDGTVEFHASPEIKDARYYWDFGDGQNGEGKDIKHNYPNDGVYVVVLTIGTTTCKSQFTAKVEVKRMVTPPTPPASFDNGCCGKVHIGALVSPQSTTPNLFVFNAGGDFKIIDVSWDFGDGTTGTGIDTKHAYANTGKYLVVTTIKGEFCTVIINTWIHVNDVVNPPPPNPCNIDFMFTSSPISSTANLLVKFQADFKGAKPDKISWDFGDGSSSTDDPTSHVYAKAGEYKVTLTASINGAICQITKVVKVSGRVNPPGPCDIDFSFATSMLSAKFQADFKGAKPDKISWDFGDGSSSSDAATSHTYSKAGEYKVTLFVSINGVTCQVTKVIKVGTRTMNPNNNTAIVIYDVSPNPANDAVTVSIKSGIQALVTLTVGDVTNVSLIKQQVSLEPGDNQVPLNVANFKPGVYVINLYYNNKLVSSAKFQKI